MDDPAVLNDVEDEELGMVTPSTFEEEGVGPSPVRNGQGQDHDLVVVARLPVAEEGNDNGDEDGDDDASCTSSSGTLAELCDDSHNLNVCVVGTGPDEGSENDDDTVLWNDPDVLRRNRVRMTLLEFLFTYPQWSLLLFLWLASIQSGLPTFQEFVTERFEALSVLRHDEAVAHVQCTTSAFARLATDLNVTEQAEDFASAVQPRSEANQHLLSQADILSQQCSSAVTFARQALVVVLGNHQPPPDTPISEESVSAPLPQGPPGWLLKATNDTNTTEACSATHQETLWSILGEESFYASKKDTSRQVSSLLDDYMDSSLASLQQLTDYAQERAAYDYDYFVGLKIAAALNLLESLSAPDFDTIFLTMDQLAFLEQLRVALQALVDALQAAQIQINLLTTRLEAFKVSIDGFYVNYVDLYGRLQAASLFVADFLPDGVALPALFDLTDLPTADFLLPAVFEIPQFDLDINVDLLLGTVMDDLLDVLAEVLRQAAEAATDHVVLLLNEVYEQLRELLTLEDYDPPQYSGSQPNVDSMEGELSYLAELAARTQQHARDALERASSLGNNIDVPDGSSALSALNIGNASSSLLEGNATLFGYETPRFPTFSFPRWLTGFLSLVSLWWVRWLVEIALQLVRAYLILRKHETNADPILPEIDVRDDDGLQAKSKRKKKGKKKKKNDETVRPGFCSSFLLHRDALHKSITTHWLAFFAVIGVFSVWILLGWKPKVQRNCIDSSRGSFMARNLMAPVFVNEAKLPGNTFHTAAELDCRQKQRRVCHRLFSDTDDTYRDDLRAFYSIQQLFNDSVAQLDVLGNCIDTDYLDEEFERSCCGLDGYETTNCIFANASICPIDDLVVPPASFRPVGEYLAAPACHSDLASWRLDDTRFDCQRLEDACSNVPCPGVDEDRIRLSTIEAQCQLEIYEVKLCVFLLLTLYHAIVINMFCGLFFEGLKRIRWRELTTGNIPVRTSANMKGELKELMEDGGQRQAVVDQHMEPFERAGRMQRNVAVIIFVLWAFSFPAMMTAAEF